MTKPTATTSDVRGGTQTAELLFDPDRLSELIGAPVHATRLRHKAGHSTVAALVRGDRPVGWIRVLQPHLADKVHNIVRRATEHGRRVLVRDVPGSRLRFAAGGITTDPRLIKALDEISRRPEQLRTDLGIAPADAGGLFAPADRVLRYNPFRRLLLRAKSGDRTDVLRLSTERAPAYLGEVRRLAAAGAPVAFPSSAGRRVSRWPWIGTTDLAALIDAGGSDWQQAVTEAGRTLARVHTFGRPVAPRDARADHPAERFTALGQDLTGLDASLGERFGQLTERVLGVTVDQTRIVIHGDCSADQVAVDADTRTTTWLDFERIRMGDFREDLGSFAAAELVRAPDSAASAVTAFLDGYEYTGDAASLAPWTARALLGRVLEPFRAADPEWRSGISTRLDHVEALL